MEKGKTDRLTVMGQPMTDDVFNRCDIARRHMRAEWTPFCLICGKWLNRSVPNDNEPAVPDNPACDQCHVRWYRLMDHAGCLMCRTQPGSEGIVHLYRPHGLTVKHGRVRAAFGLAVCECGEAMEWSWIRPRKANNGVAVIVYKPWRGEGVGPMMRPPAPFYAKDVMLVVSPFDIATES